MAPAFGNVKYSEFDPGDSILKSTNLIAAFNECSSRYGTAVAAYNAANPAVAIAAPDMSIDPETSQRSSTFTLLANKEYDTASNSFRTVPLNYIQAYSGWVSPTTGNLAGVASLPAALYLLQQAFKANNDLIQPNLLFADPSGNTTINDASDGSIECTNIMVVNQSYDAVTGLPTFTPWNYFTLLDEQQGV
jgi:hypothetical protein